MFASFWKSWLGLKPGIKMRARKKSAESKKPSLHELESRINPSLTMLGDLNPNGMGSSIRFITAFGNDVYFTADDGIHGNELWRSSGATGVTELFKDINPGPANSYSGNFTVVNGFLFFTATGPDNIFDQLYKTDGNTIERVKINSSCNNLVNFKNELFFTTSTSTPFFKQTLMRSDGTQDGTKKVADLNSPRLLTPTTDYLFFSNGGPMGEELWKSDGTSEGTSLVKDIFDELIPYPSEPGSYYPASSSPQEIIASGPMIYFTAIDKHHGRELWKSDGTTNGTLLVKDISPGLQDSSPTGLFETGGILYFSADDGMNGREPWISRGIAQDTLLLKDINSGSASSSPVDFTTVDGVVYFSALNTATGRELWRTNGVTAGSTLVKDINPAWSTGSEPTSLTSFNGLLYFAANNGSNGEELWKSDGTEYGTRIALDIRAGNNASRPDWLAVVNNALYFTADDGVKGAELWRSTGYSSETKIVKDVNPSFGNFNPKDFIKIGETIFFTADDGSNGRELWKTDGTKTGTFLVKDIFLGPNGSTPDNLTSFNGSLYFTAVDKEHGCELWKSDGSPSGTIIIRDIVIGANGSDPQALKTNGSQLLFLAEGGLWKSNGSAAGTEIVRKFVVDLSSSVITSNICEENGLYFFSTSSQETNGDYGLWRSDGTNLGTYLIKNIGNSASQSIFASTEGYVFFIASTQSYGIELWKSDGFISGTEIVADINTSYELVGSDVLPKGSFPKHLATSNNSIFFSAFYEMDGIKHRGLWKGNSSKSGAAFIKELHLGVPYEFGKILKELDIPENQWEPFLFPYETSFAFVKSNFLFSAGEIDLDFELWKSDGTTLGTNLIKEIQSGSKGSNPSSFTSFKDNVYFTADDGMNGRELWVTDGTGNGTRLIQDLYPGVLGSNPEGLTATDNQLFFSATDPIHGTELWVYSVDSAPTINSSNKATFTAGQAGNHVFTASGFPHPQFSLVTGALPAGLALNTDGTLSGVPASDSGGTYTFTVQASNGIGSNALQSFTLTVNQAPVITSTGKASFMVNKVGAFAVTANGYPAPAFSVSTGNLPGGLSLTSDGKLQGTPQTGSLGSYTFQIKAANAGGTSFQTFTATVNGEGVFSVAAMGGGRDFSKLAIYKNGTKELLREVIPFPGFKGEFYVDSGDISGDGVEDIIVGSGNGSQNGHVVVFDGAVLMNPNTGKVVELPYSLGGSVRASLYAFVGYSSGVAVRLADMNDDGFDDMVLAPGTGAGTSTPAHLRVWNGKDCMADFEAGKPLPYDYRWEMSSFWAFGDATTAGGGMALSVIRQAGPDLIVASQLFRGGSKVFRYDGQKVLTTVLDLTGWQDLLLTGNTVVGFDREGNRFFANGGTNSAATDTIFVRDKDKKPAYVIDKIFGGTLGGLRLGLVNMDADAEDELLVIRGTDSTTKVYDLFADKAVLIDALKPGGNSGWV